MSIADRVVVMDNSHINMVGSTKDILPKVNSARVCGRLKGEGND